MNVFHQGNFPWVNHLQKPYSDPGGYITMSALVGAYLFFISFTHLIPVFYSFKIFLNIIPLLVTTTWIYSIVSQTNLLGTKYLFWVLQWMKIIPRQHRNPNTNLFKKWMQLKLCFCPNLWKLWLRTLLAAGVVVS